MTWTAALFWFALVLAACLYLGDHLNTLAAALRELNETLKGKP